MSAEGLIDRPQGVRAGEELPLGPLAAYLTEKLGTGELAIEQFPAGHSNLTYLLRSGERELVLRRPPFGTKVKSAHDMGREYRILSRLSGHFPVPRPLLHCEDLGVIGAPFYVMERVRGVILRRTTPPGLDLAPPRARAVAESFIAHLAGLHRLDFAAIGLGDLGRPEGYVERQVRGWTRRYHDARTDEVAEAQALADWLEARIPRESGAALVHNDFKYDNLILDPEDPTRVLAVLDWEMATVGDPLMDLGTALAYWVEAGDPPPLHGFAFGPTAALGSPGREELAALYFARSGRPPRELLFYYCFALWKNAVVAQQIYRRYRDGLTRDPRFAGFGMAVQLLCTVALGAIERGRLGSAGPVG